MLAGELNGYSFSFSFNHTTKLQYQYRTRKTLLQIFLVEFTSETKCFLDPPKKENIYNYVLRTYVPWHTETYPLKVTYNICCALNFSIKNPGVGSYAGLL